MTNVVSGKDKINSLCKKFFTPQLCDEPVTESKQTLKNKILTQLIKFGDWLVQKYFAEDQTDLSMVVMDTIEKCWEKWENGEMEGQLYATYFGQAIKSNCVTELKKKDNNNISVYSDSEDDESESNYEMYADIKNQSPDIYFENKNSILTVLKIVETAYRNKERKKHKEWLSPILTLSLFDALQGIFNTYGEELLKKYSFADSSIYTLDEKPTRKEIAKSLGYDEGYLSKELKDFLAPIEQEVRKVLEI